MTARANCILSAIFWASVFLQSVCFADAGSDASPVIRILSPAQDSILKAGANLSFWIDQDQPAAELRYVSVYAGALLLGSTNRLPALLTWSNAPPGIYILTAIALDVNGRYGTSAPVTIQIVTPPANDDWQNAIPIDGTNAFTSGKLLGATTQEMEPWPRKSIWWRWTSPISGKITIISGGTYPVTQVSVTTNPEEVPFREILSVFRTNDYHGLLTFAAEAGLTYWISLFEGPGAPEPLPTDEVNLELRLANSPPNDAFESPIHLTGGEVVTNFSNVEGVQVVSNYFLWGPTVWFLWQPPSNGLYEIFLPPTLASQELLLTGSSLTNLSPLPPRRIGAVFSVRGDASYYLRIQTWYQVGDFELRISPYPPASNDDFAERTATSGSNVVFTGDFDGATPDPGQPDWLGDTLWWSWTAPASGRCRITNEPNSYCSIAVLVGESVSNLNAIVPTNGILPSVPEFYAEAGITYQIALSSLYGGVVRLAYVSIPSNDNFANREHLFGSNVTTTAIISESTVEPGEPYAWAGDRSVWYEWIAPWTGPFSVKINKGRPILAVYTGSVLTSLTLVPWQAGRNPDGNSFAGSAAVDFDAVEGASYEIQILGGSTVTLDITPRPVNDDFSDRIDISGTNVGTGSCVGATADPLQEYCDQTIWWKWTAPSNGNYTLSTAGSDPFYIIRVRHDKFSSAEVTAAFWSSNGPSAAHLTATNGETFSFMFCGSSNAVIHIGERHPPPNDNFADRIDILQIPADIPGTLFGASYESFEYGAIVGPHSVWYSWTPVSDGVYCASIEGSNYPVHLDIYKGMDPADLEDITGLRRVYPSGAVSFQFSAIAGIPLQIRVSQDDSSEGNFVLHLQPLRPADDGCSEATEVTGLSFAVTGTTFPDAGCLEGPATTCFSWTAPTRGIYKGHLTGNNQVKLLKQEEGFWIFEGSANLFWFEATQGAPYRFVVGANGLVGGQFAFEVAYQPPPPNDDFLNRIKIVRDTARFLGTTSGASTEPGEPLIDFGNNSSVWWSWRAPSRRTVRLFGKMVDDTCPLISVYTGSTLSELNLVARGWCDLVDGTSLSFQAEPDVEYQIAILMPEVPGDFDVSFEAPPPFAIFPPAGDNPLQLYVEGPAGVPSTIEASTNLLDWAPISTNLNINGTFWLPDPAAKLFQQRFYRIR